MTADKKLNGDYIPISTTSLISNNVQLVKPNIIDQKDCVDEFNVPLTPSPTIGDQEVFCPKMCPQEPGQTMFNYDHAYPTYTQPFIPTSSPEMPPGYYTPPTPFHTPSPVTPGGGHQTFLFDQPAYMPQIYNYTNTGQYMVPTECSQPPHSKRPRTKGPGKKHTKVKKSNVAKTVQEMKTTLLEYHNAASDELWRPGGEPRKKNKFCQTTFKHPLQLASFEEFTSLAVLLSVFGKEASEDAGRRYGVKPKTKANT